MFGSEITGNDLYYTRYDVAYLLNLSLSPTKLYLVDENIYKSIPLYAISRRYGLVRYVGRIMWLSKSS